VKIKNNKPEVENILFTDNEWTKQLIWENFSGFIENYRKYILYAEGFNRPHREYAAGMYSYANNFYELMRPYIIKINTKEDTVLKQLEELFERETQDFKYNDWRKIRRIFNSIMVSTGIMNITFQKSNLFAKDNYEPS